MKGWSNFIPVTLMLIHCCFLLSGWLIGWALDELVWFLSHDYVFPPDLFVRRALMISWLAAAMVVCALSWYSSLDLSPATVIRRTAAGLIVAFLISVVVLALVFGFATLGWQFPGVSSPGPRRHQISAAIPYAASFAAFSGCLIFVYLSCPRLARK